jgi:hypothetical protein
MESMKPLTKGITWLRSDPPKGKHTHDITSGLDVGVMRRVLDYEWKFIHYTWGYHWYIGVEPTIDRFLMEGGWNV